MKKSHVRSHAAPFAIAGFLISLATFCAPARSAAPAFWCIDDMAKIDPTTGKAHEENPQLLPGGLKGDYRAANTVWDGHGVKLTGAKNEVVAFQIIINGPATGLTFTPSQLLGSAGAIPAQNLMLFREWYLKVEKSSAPDSLGIGWYPDALIPMELGSDKYGAPLDIPDPRNHVDGQQNQAVWVDVYIPANASPGHYKGKIAIGGAAAAAVPIDLEVLNFALPNTYHYTLNLNSYGETEKMPATMRLKYFQLFQRHRIYLSIDSSRIKPTLDASTGKIDWTSYDEANGPLLDGSAFTDKAGYGPGPMQGTPLVFWELPFAANIQRARKNVYRAEAWPADFNKAHMPEYETLFKNTLTAFEQHFNAKGWTKTNYVLFFNGADEPTAYSEYQDIKYLAGLAADVKSPLFKFKADFGHFADCAQRVPQLKSLQNMLDFLDPTVTFWAANGGCKAEGQPLFNVDALAGEVAKGKLAFFYGTNPPPDQGGCFVDSESLGARLWPLIAARYNLSGGEIWECTYKYKQAWEGKPTSDAAAGGGGMYGYAQYLYPENGLGVDFGGPIASIRLKNFRRGQQDSEYYWLAPQGPHKTEADHFLQTLILKALDKASNIHRPNPGDWIHDPAEYERARLELGRLLATK